MSESPTQQEAWQAEADLLAEGREWLEAQCGHWRLRHLFPGGPDLALLLRAYQDLDRLRQTRPDRYPNRRRRRRALRRLIAHRVREEALARDRRLHWHYPLPRTQLLKNPPPPIVNIALASVDADARTEVRRHVTGGLADETASLSGSMARVSRVEARIERGLRQFATALFNAALSEPRQIRTLHPQYISFLESEQPTKTAHPVATLLLVKLPLRVLATLLIAFTVVYVGAWVVLNHRDLDNGELIAGILTDRLSHFLVGDLEFEHVTYDLDLLPSLFIPGRKAHLHARGVDVYAPAEPLGLEQRRQIAHADAVDLELDLLEIIPWNRLGVPGRLEIPWLLHFGHVETHGEFWLEVHQYAVADEPDPRYGLVEAFQVASDIAQPEGLRTIGIRLDDLVANDARFVLDFQPASRWSTELWFDQLRAELDFEGHFPELPQAPVIPLAWSASGTGGHGTVDASGQHLELTDLLVTHAGTGREQTPMGDMRVTGSGEVYGSPVRFDGFLRRLLDRERPVSLAYKITTPDAGGVVAHFVPEPADGRPPAVVATGTRAMVSATGDASDPTVRLVAQGLQLNLLPEPAWAFDDVDVSLSLARDPVPEKWDGDRPEPDPDEVDDERWQVYFDTVRGAALDGDMRLGSTGGESYLVLPGSPREPLLVSLGIALQDVNPGQLTPHDPKRSAMLAGAADGEIELSKLILERDEEGGYPFHRAEVRLHDIRVRRDRGPEIDRLPRQLRADGEIYYDTEAGLDLRALRLSTDGGTINASGGVDADWETLRNGALAVSVNDGRAFLDAFGLDHYFDQLELELGFRGPIGAPSGDEGRLVVDNLQFGELLLSDLTDARVWMDRGTLRIRAADARLLGGHGPLEVDVGLFERGKLASDPKIRVFADLSEMDRENLFGAPVAARGAEVRLFVDDGGGGPVRLSEFQARGAAYAERLQLGPNVFRDATTQFAFTDDGLRIDALDLAYHRGLSPLHAPDATVALGRLSATGSVTFGDETKLDLEVTAFGIPLSAIMGLADADLPVRGQIARGTKLHVEGLPRRPRVTGLVALDSLSASDIPLGGGQLTVSTDDIEATSELAAHRVVTLKGDLEGQDHTREDELDWHLAAYVAFPEASARGVVPEARIDVDVTALPIANLLATPERRHLVETLAGQLNGLRIDATYCGNTTAITPECAARSDAGAGLDVALGLDRFWVGPRRPATQRHPLVAATGDPCSDPLTICSVDPLEAHLAENMVELEAPWTLRSGGRDGSVLAVDGNFDLTAPPPSARARPSSCDDQTTAPAPPAGRGLATAQGRFDFRALAPIIEAFGLEGPKGALDIAIQVSGLVMQPAVTGTVELPPDVDAVTLDWQDETIEEAKARGRRKPNVVPVALESLWLEVDAGRLFVDGDVRVFDEKLAIHGRPETGRRRTHITLGGPCQGEFALSADGVLDGALLAALFPDLISASSGRARLTRLEASGFVGDSAEAEAEAQPSGGRGSGPGPGEPAVPRDAATEPRELIERLEAELVLGRDAALILRTEIDRFSVNSGKIEVQRCQPYARCPAPLDDNGAIGVFLGGQLGSTAGNRPRDAVAVKVGERGSADAWGWLSILPDLSGLGSASMNAKLDRVPYTQLDNSGSPELELALSTPRLSLRADEFGGLSLTGRVLVEKSRWLRNANVGTSVLSFSDPVPAPPTQLHPTLRDLALSLDVRTTAPFRADINVIHGLEASAEVSVDGTVGAPEFTGSVVLERGEIDIPIIGEPYEINRGRMVIDRDIRNSRIDVSAVGLEPKLIDNQLKTVTLNVQGPLDSITWSCSTLGDVSGALSTTRGCTEYILFGAGDAEIAQTDVSRAGAGGNLVGRPLTLVGNLTEVTLNDYLKDEAPRLEAYTPEVSARVEQLGFAVKMETKPEWLDFGGSNLNFGVNYLRGYPGGLLRDSTKFYGRFEILEHSALEFSAGRRNFTQRQLVLDPPVYSGIEFVQSYRIPSRR